jgi:nucleoside-diphosphate-sugar epimerase
MKATVFGATGFIGSHLVRYLRSQGYEVSIPSRDSRAWCNEPLGHVFYCIGLTADFRSRPLETVHAHVSLAAEILRHGIFESFLYLSSTRVYGRALSAHETTVTPVHSADPSDLYNLSKLMGEALCLSLGRDHVRVARLSNVFGADFASENFLTSIIRDAARTGKVVLRTALESEKDYVSIDDVTYSLERISRNGSELIYNVASGSNTRHDDIMLALSRATDCEVIVEDNAPIQRFPAIDIARLSHLVDRKFALLPEQIPNLVEAFSSQSDIDR